MTSIQIPESSQRRNSNRTATIKLLVFLLVFFYMQTKLFPTRLSNSEVQVLEQMMQIQAESEQCQAACPSCISFHQQQQQQQQQQSLINSGQLPQQFPPLNFTTLHQDMMTSTYQSLGPDNTKTCMVEFLKIAPQLQKYIQGLELLVPSIGGVGSNYLINFLHDKTNVRVRDHDPKSAKRFYRPWFPHEHVCHIGNPLLVPLIRPPHNSDNTTQHGTPTLVIVGDFWYAMASQQRRDYLEQNIAKNIYGRAFCPKPLQNYTQLYPHDPAGYKKFLWTYMTQQPSNTVFLKAPYTLQGVRQALCWLGLPALAEQVQQKGLHVKNLVRHNKTRATKYSLEAFPELAPLYEPYRELEEHWLNQRLPDAWRAQDTPPELLEYLWKDLAKE